MFQNTLFPPSLKSPSQLKFFVQINTHIEFPELLPDFFIKDFLP